MEIILAKSAGFCFGVQRAIDIAVKEAEKNEKDVYTLGPIVHNEIVISDMEKRGVKVISEDELSALPEKSTVIIRAHGITKKLEEQMRSMDLNVVDATCPFVKKIHSIVNEESRKGHTILIAGDEKHPEVKGIRGWCEGEAFVVSASESDEVWNKIPDKSLCLVSQTTFNQEKFKNIVEKLKKIVYNPSIVNTICNATRERQTEASDVAETVDVMIVIGSTSSSNSQKLYDICREKCNHTYFIQSMADLQKEWFQGIKSVGITAGASTPKNLIKEVQTYVRKF